MPADSAIRRLMDLRLKPYVRMLVRTNGIEMRDELMLAMQAEVQRVVGEQLNVSPEIWAKVIPADPGDADLLIASADPTATRGDDGLPVPPEEMWEVEGYRSGDEHVDKMREALAAAGCDIATVGSILDFGCGSARMIRQLAPIAEHVPVWGVDINVATIVWCIENLSPPFHFLTCTTMPSLPFEDGTFGLVYAGSVFTHISELGESWLAELRRITRPGGYLYLTIQDQAYLDCIRSQRKARHWSAQLVKDNEAVLSRLGDDLSMVALGRATKNSMVYHDRASLLRSWGRTLEVVDVVDEAYDIQTAVVLRRPV